MIKKINKTGIFSTFFNIRTRNFKMTKPKSGNSPKKKGRFFKSIIITIVIALIIRIFIFEVYLVPSSSMADTILPGEIILVNKLSYGARLHINSENDRETRMPGFSKIKQNDIVVFNFPDGDTIYKNRPDINFYDNIGWQGHWKAVYDTIEHGPLVYQPVKYRQPYVKRCIALPGDTIQIIFNIVFVNGQYALGNEEYWAFLKDSLTTDPFVFLQNFYNPETKEREVYNHNFPHHTNEQWYKQSYGPLYIPRKGDTVKLNINNLSIYYRIISAFEHNLLEISNDSVYINGKLTDKYIFKQNYYFMMGDNFWNSIDSRFWGFVPENHIIAKAIAIVWSWDKNKPGWFKFRTGQRFYRTGNSVFDHSG